MPTNYNRRRYYTPSLSSQLRDSHDNNKRMWDKLASATKQAEEWKTMSQMLYIQLESLLTAAGESVDDNEVIKRYKELLAGGTGSETTTNG